MPDACRRVLLALFLALLPLAAAENAEGPRPVRALQSAPSQLLFNFTASRGYANSMQVSEIRLYDASGNLITTTGATNPGGTPPYPQQMAFAAEDGSIYTKWVDTSFGANGNSQLLLVPSTPVPIAYCEPATPHPLQRAPHPTRSPISPPRRPARCGSGARPFSPPPALFNRNQRARRPAAHFLLPSCSRAQTRSSRPTTTPGAIRSRGPSGAPPAAPL